MQLINYVEVIILVTFVIIVVIKGGELKRHVPRAVLDECIELLRNTIGAPGNDFCIDEVLNYKFNANPYDEYLLNELCHDILKHCGMRDFSVVVSLQEQENRHIAGTYHSEDGVGIINIVRKPYALDFETKATLTHECMHYFLRRRNIFYTDTLTNEWLTDVATVYMGFWPLMGDGYFKQGYLTTKDLKYVLRSIGKAK